MKKETKKGRKKRRDYGIKEGEKMEMKCSKICVITAFKLVTFASVAGCKKS